MVFMLSVFLSSGVFWFLWHQDVQKQQMVLKLKETSELSTQKQVISRYVQAIAIDVLVVSRFYPLRIMLDHNEPHYRESLSEAFLWFSKIKRIYDQVRLLNEQGMEIVRVNFNDGAPSIVACAQLQPKGNRYYFKDAFQLNEGEVFVSPFDLNIERGVLEIPIKPMIRFATPVFDSSGKKRGVVLLNYLGADLLKVLEAAADHMTGGVMLLNSDGYYLRSPNHDDEWAFMFASKKNTTFAWTHPDVWQKISRSESGQFADAHGIYSYTTIRPVSEVQISSTGSAMPYSPSEKRVKGTQYHWKLVSLIPYGSLRFGNNPPLRSVLFMYAAMVVLCAAGSGCVAYASSKRRRAEKEVRQQRDFLGQLVEQRTMELKRVNQELLNDIDRRIQLEQDRERLLGNMAKRVKELQCTYGVAESIRKRTSLAELFADVAALMPPAWQYPEKARARIRFGVQQVVSQPFSETPWRQKAQIMVAGDAAGTVELFYLEQCPQQDEGPFTGEERSLIDSIASALSQAIEHQTAITALGESEEKYRSMMEAMDDTAYICSKDFRVLYINSSMREKLGCEAVGERCYEVIYGLDHPCRWCLHEKVMKGENAKTEMVNPKDNKYYLESNSPIFHTDGSISKLTILRDNTEVKTIEARLRQAQKMESVGRLAGGVAHDYNNALSVIIGFAELAIDGVDPLSPLRANLDEIINAAGSAAEITRQLLAFASKQEIAPKPMRLNTIVGNMLKMLRRLIGEDIELTWVPAPNLWAVKVDPSQVNQIVANLCVNARQAIKGVGKITIETRNICFNEADCVEHTGFAPGEYVMLAVSDDGCGIEEGILEKIFEPFFTTKAMDKGTGLGLATVYGIVKQNKGYIDVKSESGKGTAVKVYLRRHVGQIVEDQPIETESPFNGNGETILLVEDDPAILNLTRQLLTGLGYSVMAAGTPTLALKISQNYPDTIHLLITDVIMPEMNGCDLVRKMETVFPDIKHMFMSGYTADVIGRSAALDQSVQIMRKPFSRKELAATVRKALED
jgi:nitrogen-specific signal transduction histidine kinase/ActR/RegA family two-component response regulator